MSLCSGSPLLILFVQVVFNFHFCFVYSDFTGGITGPICSGCAAAGTCVAGFVASLATLLDVPSINQRSCLHS